MPHAAKSRPLSPHLQVYRLPLAAWLSISHRLTGVGLTLGLLLLAAWVISAAYGPEAYGAVSAFAGSPLGYLVLFGFSVALFFHLCNGLRHLLWDTGRNFEIAQTKRGNVYVLLGTIILTAFAWYWALA